MKTGCGAFMKREEDAVRLAEVMVETGKRMGKKTVALITDMDQPLGRTAGHAIEIVECIEVLSGRGPGDLRELSIELSAWMFYLGERTKSVDEGRQLAGTMIASGQAKEKFKQGIRLQGGDDRVINEPQRLPAARSHAEVPSPMKGYIAYWAAAVRKRKIRSITPSGSSSASASAIASKKASRSQRSITIRTPSLRKRRV